MGATIIILNKEGKPGNRFDKEAVEIELRSHEISFQDSETGNSVTLNYKQWDAVLKKAVSRMMERTLENDRDREFDLG